jgi:hypothetical protein
MDFNFDTSTISSILELDPGSSNLTIMGPAGVIVPVGTTAQRVATPGTGGIIRFNTTYGLFETYDGTNWSNVQVGNSNLSSLSSLTGTGFVVQTGPGAFVERVITGTSGEVLVSNGSGVAGNVVVGLATAGTAGTYATVTTDTFGRVTAGNTVQSWSTIVDRPTTLTGYGILDAFKAGANVAGISAGTFAGRPAAGTLGNFYYATDTTALYYDNGVAWTLESPALTGDVTTTAGGVATTLATVNGNIGTFGSTTVIPVITVNAKGLITAVNTATISGSISVTGGDLTMSGSTGTAITNATLNTVNSNVGFFGSNAAVATFTVNSKGLVTSAGNVAIVPEAIGAVNVNLLAVANGVATLGVDGRLTNSQIPTSLVGALVYKGVWNAQTNFPTITNGVGTVGWYYKVNIAGTTNIDGNNNWTVGDMIVFNGTTWDGIDGLTTEVTSVFGRTGAVTATLASSDFANQGTTTTVLHGNVAGAPFWSAINLASDVTGTLPITSFPALTGDITTSTGNVATTLATVNSNTGAFGSATQVPTFVVNGKGLITAAANVTIPNSLSFTGNVTGSGSVGSGVALTLEDVGTAGTYGSATAVPVITTDSKGRVTSVSTSAISSSISATGADFTFSGTTGTAITNGTLATVNANVGTFGNATYVPTITVNGKGLVTAASTVAITASGTGAVANAGGAPSIQEGVFASMPAAGTTGAIYVATDTKAIYRDNGVSWDQIGESSLLYTENASAPTASTVTGANAVSIGSDNRATSSYALATGFQSNTAIYGGEVRANGSFAVAGDAQAGKYVLRNRTTSTTQTELFLDGVGGSARIVLLNNSAVAYSALFAAHDVTTANTNGAWKINGLIKRDANQASTALVGNRSKSVLTRPNANWDVEVYADTTNGALTFKVTGPASDTVRWVCTVVTTEVTS